jgi:hypothetical protein
MRQYFVTVRETHTFTLTVEATDPSTAIEKAEAMLAADDFNDLKREPDSIDTDIEDWDVEEVGQEPPILVPGFPP